MQSFGHNFWKLTAWLSSMDTWKVNDIFGTELIVYEQQIFLISISMKANSGLEIHHVRCDQVLFDFKFFLIHLKVFKLEQYLTSTFTWEFQIHSQCLDRNYTKTNQTKIIHNDINVICQEKWRFLLKGLDLT